MTGPLDSQYLVLDEMVARYGDEEIRGAMLENMALPAEMCAPWSSAAEVLDVATAQEADAILEQLSVEFPVAADEADNDAVAGERQVQAGER